MEKFNNRLEAGKKLAQIMNGSISNTVVLYAMPRGGVPVAYPLARKHNKQINLIISRKIGHPQYPEYAICAVTENKIVECSEEARGVNSVWLKNEIKKQHTKAKKQSKIYLDSKTPPALRGRDIILVDDGVATGLTLLAAIKDILRNAPNSVTVGVPVIAKKTAILLRGMVDRVEAVLEPREFAGSVGEYYKDFRQVSDEEVVKTLSHLVK